MTRRRPRTTRRKMTSPWVIAAQILVLLAFLVALLNIQDSIGDGTSAIVESLASEDVDVQSRQDMADAGQTDDGAEEGEDDDLDDDEEDGDDDSSEVDEEAQDEDSLDN